MCYHGYCDYQHYLLSITQLVSECRELRAKCSQARAEDKDDNVNKSESHVTVTQGHVIAQLQKQNTELHSVIRQMRRELEELAEPTSQMATSLGYVQYMEKELNDLKTRNRDLEEQVKTMGKPPSLDMGKPPHPRSPSVERKHRSHVIALSDTIASLQRDKCSLELELSQGKSRLEQLEGVARDYKEKVRVQLQCSYVCLMIPSMGVITLVCVDLCTLPVGIFSKELPHTSEQTPW